jgi:transposase-like protein
MDERHRKPVGTELLALENVRCLACAAVYTKPAGGGTASSNPGCPDCGYVGWAKAGTPLISPWPPSRSDAGHLRRRFA